MRSTFQGSLYVSLFLSSYLVGSAWAVGSYHAGDGSEDNPFQILMPADLMQLSQHPEDYDKHFILLADIDMDPDIPGNQRFTQAVIAPNNSAAETFSGTPFSGTFDGSGYKIQNLTFEDPMYSFLGLFGRISEEGTVINLGVENVTFRDYHFDNILVGFFAGENNGTLIQCHAAGQRRLGEWYEPYYRPMYIGGLVGRNSGFIFDCYSKGQIIGGQYAGGLVGHNQGGYINHCYSACSITDCMDYIGGLVGRNEGSSVISYSYAVGSIQNSFGWVGGLVGYNQNHGVDQKAVINRCYASGSVEYGNGFVGEVDDFTVIKNCYSVGAAGYYGFMGDYNRRYTEIINCFWDTQAGGTTSSYGAVGLTTQQMKQRQTFLDVGWDFDSTWDMIEGRTYPSFQWQEDPLENLCKDSRPFPVGDLNSDCTVDLNDFSLFVLHWMDDIRR